MNEFIAAAHNQTIGHSRNVKLSDDTYAFINSKGIAKKFSSAADYNATKGKNGCPGDAETLDRTWENIQYRVGAPMMAGQSCGGEDKIVQLGLGSISEEFDKPYYESVSNNNFSTVEEAITDWNNSGRQSGLAPYEGALKLQELGKMGYVDIDSEFHHIPITRLNDYNAKTTSYVRGANMVSCLPLENVKFRSKAYIKTGNSYLYADGASVKVWTGSTSSLPSSSVFYIQVPVSAVSPTTATIPTTQYTSPIDYEAKCLLSTDNSWRNTDPCKYWGCHVGRIHENTFSLSENIVASNLSFISAAGLQGTIKYGEQFYIQGEVYKNMLIAGEMLTTVSSTSGQYQLTFENRELVIKDTTAGTKKVLKSGVDSQVNKVVWTGTVMYFIDTDGVRVDNYFDFRNSGECSDKCVLTVTNTGAVRILNVDGKEIYQEDSSLPDGTDLPTIIYATIVDGVLGFSKNISERASFSFERVESTTKSCDIDALKAKCNSTENCTGFIHSERENTWQPIRSSDSASNYAISEFDTDVYLRYTSGKLTGSYCPSDDPTTINRKRVVGYPQGNAVTDITASCKARPPLKVPAFDTYLKSINDEIATPATPVSDSIHPLKDFPTDFNPLLTKYTSAYSQWLASYDKPTALGNTLQQRLVDTRELDEYYKSMAILWGVITIAMISIILFRPRN